MKAAIGLALALALALSSAPAFAGDTFRALSSLPTLEQVSFTPLSDAELASIEGGLVVVINRNRQIARVRQANIAVGSAFVYQANVATVRQNNID